MAKKRKNKPSSLEEKAAATPTTKAPGKGTWKLMDKGATIAAGLVAQRATMLTWRAVTGKKPPTTGRHPEVSTREAVAWAVIGGAMVELVKVATRRGAATYWVKSTGQLPPGMKPLVKTDVTDATGNAKEPTPKEPAPASSPRKVSRRNRGR